MFRSIRAPTIFTKLVTLVVNPFWSCIIRRQLSHFCTAFIPLMPKHWGHNQLNVMNPIVHQKIGQFVWTHHHTAVSSLHLVFYSSLLFCFTFMNFMFPVPFTGYEHNYNTPCTEDRSKRLISLFMLLVLYLLISAKRDIRSCQKKRTIILNVHAVILHSKLQVTWQLLWVLMYTAHSLATPSYQLLNT